MTMPVQSFQVIPGNPFLSGIEQGQNILSNSNKLAYMPQSLQAALQNQQLMNQAAEQQNATRPQTLQEALLSAHLSNIAAQQQNEVRPQSLQEHLLSAHLSNIAAEQQNATRPESLRANLQLVQARIPQINAQTGEIETRTRLMPMAALINQVNAQTKAQMANTGANRTNFYTGPQYALNRAAATKPGQAVLASSPAMSQSYAESLATQAATAASGYRQPVVGQQQQGAQQPPANPFPSAQFNSMNQALGLPAMFSNPTSQQASPQVNQQPDQRSAQIAHHLLLANHLDTIMKQQNEQQAQQQQLAQGVPTSPTPESIINLTPAQLAMSHDFNMSEAQRASIPTQIQNSIVAGKRLNNTADLIESKLPSIKTYYDTGGTARLALDKAKAAMGKTIPSLNDYIVVQNALTALSTQMRQMEVGGGLQDTVKEFKDMATYPTSNTNFESLNAKWKGLRQVMAAAEKANNQLFSIDNKDGDRSGNASAPPEQVSQVSQMAQPKQINIPKFLANKEGIAAWNKWFWAQDSNTQQQVRNQMAGT
jgi:hypothetical protein